MRHLLLDAIPLLDPIRDPLSVRLCIKMRSTGAVAGPTVLVIHSSIISSAIVHSDSDGDLSAGPGVRGAVGVVAGELAHDVCVVAFGAGFIVIDVVELEV